MHKQSRTKGGRTVKLLGLSCDRNVILNRYGSLGRSGPPENFDFLDPLRLILMKIAMEGPELSSACILKILDVNY